MAEGKALRTRIRNGLAGLLIPLMGFTGASKCSAIEKPEFYFENTLTTNYVAPFGFVVDKTPKTKWGGVNQALLSADFGKGFSAYLWNSHDIEDNETNELDIGVNYNHKFNDEFSGYTTLTMFTYPSKDLGKIPDLAFTIGAKYHGLIDANLFFRQVAPSKQRDYGNMTCLSLSKTVGLDKINGWSPSVTADVGTALCNSYYGFSGLTQVTPSVIVGLSKGNLAIEGFFSHQISLDKDIPRFDYFGLRFKLGFK